MSVEVLIFLAFMCGAWPARGAALTFLALTNGILEYLN